MELNRKHRHTGEDSEQISYNDLLNRPNNNSLYVRKTEDESIDGIKTFLDIPVLPASDPTTGNQAVRKAYADARETAAKDYADTLVLYAVASNSEKFSKTSGISSAEYFRVLLPGTMRIVCNCHNHSGDYVIYYISIIGRAKTGYSGTQITVAADTLGAGGQANFTNDIDVRAGDIIMVTNPAQINSITFYFTVTPMTSAYVLDEV